MADFGSTVGNVVSSTGSTAITVIIIIIGIIVAVAIVGGLFLFYWNIKRYNLIVEFKKVRTDGRFISREQGKGLFNDKRGVVYLKRKKIRGTIPMKVFDIKKYLQGEDYLEVIQVGPRDFRPVLPESYTEYIAEYENDKGEIEQVKESIINIKVDTGMDKAWKSAFENAAKKAYSIQSFLNQFQVPISIAIVLIAVFAGFALLWSRIGH